MIRPGGGRKEGRKKRKDLYLITLMTCFSLARWPAVRSCSPREKRRKGGKKKSIDLFTLESLKVPSRPDKR